MPTDWAVLQESAARRPAGRPGPFASTYGRERADPPRRWRDRIGFGAWFVAEVDGGPVGLAAGRPSHDRLWTGVI